MQFKGEACRWQAQSEESPSAGVSREEWARKIGLSLRPQGGALVNCGSWPVGLTADLEGSPSLGHHLLLELCH